MVSRFDRRSVLLGGAAAAAGVAGAGALGLGLDDIAGATTNGPGRNGVSTKTAKHGGSLVFGVDAEESGFDPTQARFDEVGVMYARTVFDPLTIITANGDWAPYLAQSVVPERRLHSWTVTLRPNLVFHDGTPCNGAALLTNFVAQSKSLLTGVVLSPTLVSITQTGPARGDDHLQGPRGSRSPTTWPAASAARSPTSRRRPCCPTPTGPRTPWAPAPSSSRSGSPTTTSPPPPTPTTGARACPICPRSPSSPSPTSRPGPRRSSRAPST